MDRISWTADETKILLDMVFKKKEWVVISQKIEKSIEACQYWLHFLQKTSKSLYPHYLSRIVLPIDIWPRVASYLNINDILSLVSVNHAIHKCVLDDDFVWQRALVKRFPFYGYLREENVKFLGKNPYFCLLKKLVVGKFLVITNADYYWNSVSAELVSTAGWNANNIDLLIVSDLANMKENLSDCTKYDAVVLVTNFGWPDDCIDELGNIIKKMIESGTGIVSCVFCGCSWVETMGGDFKKDNCNPIVPNVLENNIEGSQWDIEGKMKSTKEEHFLTLNCEKDFDTTISLGKAHPEGTVLATLVTEEMEYPLLVELKKWPGTILSVNSKVNSGETWKLVGNGILYVARDIRENWENLDI